MLYGDPAYPLLDVLQTGFKGTNLDQARRKYNTLMSKVRECVEWQFGEVVREWAFLDFAGARAASSWCGRACSARRRPAEQPQRGDAPGRRRRRRGYEPLGRRRHLDDVVALPPPRPEGPRRLPCPGARVRTERGFRTASVRTKFKLACGNRILVTSVRKRVQILRENPLPTRYYLRIRSTQ